MSEQHRRAGQARAKQFTKAYQRKAAKALVEKRGAEHMREIGRRGAKTTHKRYRFAPVGTRGWALVGRKTGEIVALIDARSSMD